MASGSPIPIRSVAHFGRALRELRADQQLTQRELAGRSGLDQATISRIESRRDAQLLSNMIDALRPLGARLVIERDDDARDRD